MRGISYATNTHLQFIPPLQLLSDDLTQRLNHVCDDDRLTKDIAACGNDDEFRSHRDELEQVLCILPDGVRVSFPPALLRCEGRLGPR